MASIGDFFVKVGWNSSELHKGIDASQKKLQEFGREANKPLTAIRDGLINVAKAYMGFQTLKMLTFDTAKATEQLANQAEMVGAKAGDIQAVGNALEHFGGNAQDATSAMRSLQNATLQARRGGGAFVEIARKFGIWVKPTQKGTDALLSIGKQLGRLSREQRMAVAKQLGFGDSLVRAFADGGEALTKLIEKQKKWGTITDEDVKISKKFNSAWRDLKDNFNSLMRIFSRYIIPLFTKLFEIAEKFITYLREHKMVLVGVFAAILVAMLPVLATLTAMVAEALLLAAPFIAVGAAIATIGLIFEDIWGYFNGWDSVTGRLIEKFPALVILIEPLRPLVLGIADVFRSILNWLKEPTWENFVNILKKAGNVIVEAIKTPFTIISNILEKLMEKIPSLKILIMPFYVTINAIKDAFQTIVDLISSISIDGIVNSFKSIKSTIGGWFGGDDEAGTPKGKPGFFDVVSQTWEGAKQKSSMFNPEVKIDTINVETPEIPALASSTYSNEYNNGGNITNNNTFNVNQNITGTGDSIQLGKDIGAGLVQQVNAQYQQRGRL